MFSFFQRNSEIKATISAIPDRPLTQPLARKTEETSCKSEIEAEPGFHSLEVTAELAVLYGLCG